MHYDLVIVGGGLVGAGLAAALGSSNLKIALIDAKLPQENDPRLFALNHTSCQFLENLGVWQSLLPHASPIHQVHVSTQGHFGAVRLNREDVSLPYLGYVIPAYHIERNLNEILNKLQNVTFYRPATLSRIDQCNDKSTLTIQTDADKVQITAGIVIGADGTHSTVREQAQMEASLFDYQQTAIVTRTQLKRSHHHIAYERFVEDGAIAMLPLPNDECATIWTLNHEKAKDLLALSDADFLQKLQEAFGYRLGKLQSIKPRFSFPLKQLRVKMPVKQNILLLGNSAHTLHPIAAQGFNLALYEVASLVDAMVAKEAQSAPFGAEDLVKLYDMMQKQQTVTMGITHQLTQWFTNESRLMQPLLQLGMIGLDVVRPMKRKLLQGLMGKAGRIPRLLLNSD